MTILALVVSALFPITLRAQGESRIHLLHSDRLFHDTDIDPRAQILVGNVCFRHDSALMYCDSAYFFEKDNSLHAFGHVHLIQGDSLEGWGDVLYYYGDTKLAQGRDATKQLIADNPELAEELEAKIMEALKRKSAE